MGLLGDTEALSRKIREQGFPCNVHTNGKEVWIELKPIDCENVDVKKLLSWLEDYSLFVYTVADAKLTIRAK